MSLSDLPWSSGLVLPLLFCVCFDAGVVPDSTAAAMDASKPASECGEPPVLPIEVGDGTPTAGSPSGGRDTPADFPPPTAVIGAPFARPEDVAPVKLMAVWDPVGPMVLPEDVTQSGRSALSKLRKQGIIPLAYHPLSWAELSSGSLPAVRRAFPHLLSEGVWQNFAGRSNPRGAEGLPTFSNTSDLWLEFMLQVAKTQFDAGMRGIAFDEGWGSLGPGVPNDYSPSAMLGFRGYLKKRYNERELAEKGIDDIDHFDLAKALKKSEVLVLPDEDGNFSRSWWAEQLGRPLRSGETYTSETFDLAVFWQAQDPLIRLIWAADTGDYGYYCRQRLREILSTLRREMDTYAAEKGERWFLSANVYNDLGWGNAAVGAPLLDVPMGELSSREEAWPRKNYAAFYKTMAALGKRFSSMFWPGQALFPQNDDDTELLLSFLAEAYAAGGISQHPGAQYVPLVNPFYLLIQAHEEFFEKTDNRVGLYYSLGNFMGDVGREIERIESFYGAARLLEDAHYSYDVLFQGDPPMGPGTTRWVERDLSLNDLLAYRMIVLPSIRYMTDEEVERLLNYVEQGGLLLVFGPAGAMDFSFPQPQERSQKTWTELVSQPGRRSHGKGGVLVWRDRDFAALYDQSRDSTLLGKFEAELASSIAPEMTGDLGAEIHIFRFRSETRRQQILHLVNLDFDLQADRVRRKRAVAFAFRSTAEITTIRYYTPEKPEGTPLAVRRGEKGWELTLPELHAYGVLVAE